MEILNGSIQALFLTPTIEPETMVSIQEDEIECTFNGLVGDKHFGQTKKTGGAREQEVFGLPRKSKEKIEIINWRQWSAVSIEDLQLIANNLNISPFDPIKLATLIGANILVSGIEKFSKIPVGSLFVFPNGTILKVEGENFPCVFPGKEISTEYPQVKAAHFPKQAWGLRGLVGVVFRKGSIKSGEEFEILIREY